ncbi:MAG: methyltransferase domain-containing protein [Myxococcota bacterium]
MVASSRKASPVPGAELDLAKMPGHWLLARMGKRVLRPGGIELTREMLRALDIGPEDHVVELAPGLGATTRLTLDRQPASYTGIERDEAAAKNVKRLLTKPEYRCLTGSAADIGLADRIATAVYGEAMLTMQTATQKRAIVREAFRVLEPGGRYGIHELGLTPDETPDALKDEVKRDLSEAIRVGARPLTLSEWRDVLTAEGFKVEFESTAPMHLLEPRRLIQDEGPGGVARILFNVLRTPTARRRVLAMRRVFHLHRDVLCAVTLVARKPRSPNREGSAARD